MTLSLVSTPSVPSEVLVHPLMDGWDSCQGAGLQPQCGARPLVQAGRGWLDRERAALPLL